MRNGEDIRGLLFPSFNVRSSFPTSCRFACDLPDNKAGEDDENHSSGNPSRSERTCASSCGGEVETERTVRKVDA